MNGWAFAFSRGNPIPEPAYDWSDVEAATLDMQKVQTNLQQLQQQCSPEDLEIGLRRAQPVISKFERSIAQALAAGVPVNQLSDRTNLSQLAIYKLRDTGTLNGM